ncbi:10749_t:CDS:2 [Funneliformis mosseae]|uniref:10749_t:CDS:1 n=1 Tax=Funneliformis mosseae TaxID=27381 RepID=A0A9N8UXI5_FUNMO|nr:10749_t:CDS:2 [Funneliformis mosseae]
MSEDWKCSEVFEFLNNNKIQYDFNNEDIQVVRNNKVIGIILLTLTEKKLHSIRLTFDSTAAIAQLIEELKLMKGLATVECLLNEEEYLSSIPSIIVYFLDASISTCFTYSKGSLAIKNNFLKWIF